MNEKISEQKDVRKLAAAKHQTNVDVVKAEIKRTEDSRGFALDEQAKEYATQDEYMTKEYLAKQKRDVATKIWQSNQIGDAKFVNVGKGAGVDK